MRCPQNARATQLLMHCSAHTVRTQVSQHISYTGLRRHWGFCAGRGIPPYTVSKCVRMALTAVNHSISGPVLGILRLPCRKESGDRTKCLDHLVWTKVRRQRSAVLGTSNRTLILELGLLCSLSGPRSRVFQPPTALLRSFARLRLRCACRRCRLACNRCHLQVAPDPESRLG